MVTSKLVTLAAENTEPSVRTGQTGTNAASEMQISRRFAWLGSSHNFHQFAVIDLPRDGNGKMCPEILLTNFSDTFLEIISDAGDLGTCSLFGHLDVSTAPFGWDVGAPVVIDGAPSVADIADEEFDELLESVGIGGGYCVPVHSRNGRRTVVIYFSSAAQNQRQYAALVLSTLLLFDEVDAVLRPQEADQISLPQHEIDLLRGLADGKSLSDLSASTGYSEQTIAIFLNHLKVQLEVNTLMQAIAKSIRIGLISG